jgi:hypothetical protein
MKKVRKEMKCVVYQPSDRSKIERAFVQNMGIDAALDRLEQMQRQDSNVRIVDATELSDEERRQRYISEAAVTGAFTSQAVRGIFGSRHYPGTKFGISVPALRIEGATRDDPGDVYPHEEAGGVVTILDFLNRRV